MKAQSPDHYWIVADSIGVMSVGEAWILFRRQSTAEALAKYWNLKDGNNFTVRAIAANDLDRSRHYVIAKESDGIVARGQSRLAFSPHEILK